MLPDQVVSHVAQQQHAPLMETPLGHLATESFVASFWVPAQQCSSSWLVGYKPCAERGRANMCRHKTVGVPFLLGLLWSVGKGDRLLHKRGVSASHRPSADMQGDVMGVHCFLPRCWQLQGTHQQPSCSMSRHSMGLLGEHAQAVR